MCVLLCTSVREGGVYVTEKGDYGLRHTKDVRLCFITEGGSVHVRVCVSGWLSGTGKAA